MMTHAKRITLFLACLLLGTLSLTAGEVTIKSPTSGSKVGSSARVKGKLSPFAKGHLIVFTRIESQSLDLWWPMPTPSVNESREWVCNVTVGQPTDVGKQYTILAGLYDDAVKAKVDQYFLNGKTNGKWEGMPLPGALSEVARVTVSKSSHY